MSPGEIDPTVVRRHLAAMRQSVEVLRGHEGRTVATLREDPEERWTVERGLQLCAQNALDISTHIAVGMGRDVADYASAVDMLADIGVLPRPFAAEFRGMAGFRNIIVHGYLDVDIEVLHQVLNERLNDFVEFSKLIEHFLSERHNP
ncbi:MAG: DUF86 domain-containing protein [Acidobacteria bacterium]|nr:MAG: DUF86 domain-containing protein [Acidobacteriota bacterium]